MELESSKSEVMSTGNWMVTILITAIPVVNIIMLFIWAFGATASKSKSNWAKATLIWMVIGIVIWLIYYFAFAAAVMSMPN